MEIERYLPDEREAWNDFVRASKNGTFQFLRDYMEYHADRFQDHSLTARLRRGGPLLAVLPANVGGGALESHGGLTYGGWVCNAEMTTAVMLELFAEMRRYLAARKIGLLRYRPVPHVYHRMPAEEDLYALMRAGARLVWRAPLSVLEPGNAGCRRQDRRLRGAQRARAAGLVCGESSDLVGYWELLSQVLWETYRARPVHGREEILALQRSVPEHIRLFCCHGAGQLLAGVLIYECELVVRAQYIATSREGRRQAALDLLFEHLVEEVYSKKRYLDLGTSEGGDDAGLNAGVLEFKESLGARLVVQDTYELDVAIP